jgi:hypothetical protein
VASINIAGGRILKNPRHRAGAGDFLLYTQNMNTIDTEKFLHGVRACKEALRAASIGGKISYAGQEPETKVDYYVVYISLVEAGIDVLVNDQTWERVKEIRHGYRCGYLLLQRMGEAEIIFEPAEIQSVEIT